MNEDNGISLWVIGANKTNGRLGLHHKDNVHELVSWNLIKEELIIEEIFITKYTTIYIDYDNQCWVSSHNINEECGIHNDPEVFPKRTKLSYFQERFN